MQWMHRVLAGALGGFVGGALAGLGEALVIAWTGGGEEFGVFLFGALAYGAFGAAIGGGWGVGTIVLGFLGRTPQATMGGAAGVALALLGLVVGRFRIVRDVFSENLPITSGAGIAVHLGLVVGAIVAFVVLRRILMASAERRGLLAGGALWAVGVVAIGGATTFALDAIAGASGGAFPESTAKGPNVLLIITDTLRADHIGPYSEAHASTPALNQLAADGVTFENCFAHSSWTRPSIATIVSSMYPDSHRVMHKTDLLPEDVVTLAEVFDGAGYRTSGFVTNINVAPSFNFQQGFQEYSYLAPDFFFGATDSGSKLALYSGLRLIRERFLSKSKWVANYYQDADTVNAGALPWLASNSGKPFFTLLHYMDPHDPYFEIPYNGNAVARVDTPNPDPADAEKLRGLYIDNIEYMDGFLGRVFQALSDAGVYDNTVIALVADHGEEFHEHGGWWHGTTLYEEQIHVPCLVKLPEGRRAGERFAELTGLIDIAPTLVAAAGVTAPASFQGHDALAPGAETTALFAEEDHEGNVLESIRTGQWKLIHANEGNPRGLQTVELYDMVNDRAETKNLASSQPDVVARLGSDLDALRTMAASGAVEASAGEIDDADRERLRALGYLDE